MTPGSDAHDTRRRIRQQRYRHRIFAPVEPPGMHSVRLEHLEDATAWDTGVVHHQHPGEHRHPTDVAALQSQDDIVRATGINIQRRRQTSRVVGQVGTHHPVTLHQGNQLGDSDGSNQEPHVRATQVRGSGTPHGRTPDARARAIAVSEQPPSQPYTGGTGET